MFRIALLDEIKLLQDKNFHDYLAFCSIARKNVQ